MSVKRNKQLALSPGNLRRLAVLNGYRGISDLARSVGRHRCTLHQAVRDPDRHGPTFALLSATLPIREVPSV